VNLSDIPPQEFASAAESLGSKLGRLAEELSPDEARLLAAVLVRAMNPLERMRHLDPSGLLDDDELRVLGGLPPPRT
jgi:hypothetical protein